MTIEYLQNKLAEFRQRQEQALANTQALSGAVQMLEALIEEETRSLSPVATGPQLVKNEPDT